MLPDSISPYFCIICVMFEFNLKNVTTLKLLKKDSIVIVYCDSIRFEELITIYSIYTLKEKYFLSNNFFFEQFCQITQWLKIDLLRWISWVSEVETGPYIYYVIFISTQLYYSHRQEKHIKSTYEYQLCYYIFLIKYNNNVRKWS